MSKGLIKEAARLQQLAGIINENFVGLTPINSPIFEDEDEDEDMEDSEEEYDFNAPGKKDEFDTDDDVEPTAKDVTKGDSAIRSSVDKQTKLNQLIKIKDSLLDKYKAGELTIDQFKTQIGDIPQQIKTLKADLESELSIDDEEED